MKQYLTDFISRVQTQKLSLIKKNPKLKHYFVDILFPQQNLSLPFLPIRCFKDFTIYSGETESGTHSTFFSSGTTSASRSQHLFSKKSLDIYARDACLGFELFLERHGFNKNVPIISLIPPSYIWQNSSLATMISMFKNHDFNIHYVELENSLEPLLQTLNTEKFTRSAVVFGTSLHHIHAYSLAQKNNISSIFKGTQLAIIDTGGTKGRSEAYTQEQLFKFMQNLYGDCGNQMLLSEYGMCELASQAYSTSAITPETLHNSFTCNDSLRVIAVDAKNKTIQPNGVPGFLAFIDNNNIDSFGLIITEDLGYTATNSEGDLSRLGSDQFTLLGRAPDATLKGCSLNVNRDMITLTAAQTSSTIKISKNQAQHCKLSTIISPNYKTRILERLQSSSWSGAFLENLAPCLDSWESLSSRLSKIHMPNSPSTLQIIASANIPITWLYPTVTAAMLGYKVIQIHIPSLRPNDPLASLIRNQIVELVDAVTPELPDVQISVVNSTIQSSTDVLADTLIVFGNDTTCNIFSQLLNNSQTRLLTFGEIQNSIFAAPFAFDAKILAKLCTLWMGRGCLTPSVIFVDQQKANHQPNFNIILFSALNDEWTKYQSPSQTDFFHVHDWFDIQSKLSLLKENRQRILKNNEIMLVDLCGLDSEQLKTTEISLSIAGQGLVFLADETCSSEPCFANCAKYPVIPTIFDTHMGKTWWEWLTKIL